MVDEDFGGVFECTDFSASFDAEVYTVTLFWPHRTGTDPTSIAEAARFSATFNGANSLTRPAVWRQLDSGLIEFNSGEVTSMSVDGTLEISATTDIRLDADDDLRLRAVNDVTVASESSFVEITTNNNSENETTWTFDDAGAITFPDNTVQTTAYTGSGAGLTIITPEDFEVQGVSTLAFAGAGVSVDRIDEITTVTIESGTVNRARGLSSVASTVLAYNENDNTITVEGERSDQFFAGETVWSNASPEFIPEYFFVIDNIEYDEGLDQTVISLDSSIGSTTYTGSQLYTVIDFNNFTDVLPGENITFDFVNNSLVINSTGSSGDNSYTPEDTDNWNEPAVNTVQAALDELAARVTALQNYEIDGGNAYTPPQGELLIDGNGA
jgi:hypothetical protein